MYFNDSNSFFHGIMFHNFHDNKNNGKVQGSISADCLYKLINFIGRQNIINSDIFFEKFLSKKLKKNEVCLTFDDGIKCQLDIALPVLEDLKIKSFFFPYTSMFEGKPDNIEIYRYFRANYFDTINDFYNNFYNNLNKDLNNFFEKIEKNIINSKSKYPFYSVEDIKFRFVRDIYLKKNEYEKIMTLMLNEKKIIPEELYKKLFFSKKDLISIDKLGHTIGLHSHTHPTLLENLNYEDQKKEYEYSRNIISKILHKSPNEITSMSHPNGSYNKDTIEVLKSFEIKLGFKHIMSIEENRGMRNVNNSYLEIARQDHAYILNKIN